MSEVVASIARIIPGAPEPSTTAKSQKKRRRGGKKGDVADAANNDAVSVPDTTTAALIDHAPAPSDIREGSVAPSLVAAPESTGSPLQGDDLLLKNSPIVELVTKRLKATTKKITRVTSYAVTDPAKLNDDQKRSLQTLPALEAVQKELAEVKKVIEVYEAELGQELAAKRAETDKAATARVQSAVEDAQNNLVSKTSDLLDLFRARSLVGSGAIDGSTVFSNEGERVAFFSLVDVIVGDDAERKQSAVNGFLFGNGDFEGVPFTRIYEILNLTINPPRAPTPDQPLIDDRQQSTSAPSITDEVEQPVFMAAGAPPVTASSLSFMQESEIEPSFEEGAEWVEKPAEAAEAPAPEPTAEAPAPAAPTAPVGGDGSTFDWAADHDGEGDLPSIEHFKTSGSATPAEPIDAPAPAAAAENGTAEGAQDDGFTSQRHGRGGHRGGRGYRGGGGEHRGEHRGGYRGGRGGGFRGGERGGFRGGEREGRGGWRGEGGERGGFRGGEGGERGGFRGGEGGERGGFRGGEGGERGGYRGGERGERGGYRGRGGEWRGDSERGRGRGRGVKGPFPRSGTPQAPQTPQTPTA